MPVIAVFLCPNLVRRIATKGPDPIVRNVMIEEAMAASALPETQFFYIFFLHGSVCLIVQIVV